MIYGIQYFGGEEHARQFTPDLPYQHDILRYVIIHNFSDGRQGKEISWLNQSCSLSSLLSKSLKPDLTDPVVFTPQVTPSSFNISSIEESL